MITHRPRLLLSIILIVAVCVLLLGRSVMRVKTTGAPWGSSARSGDDIVTLITWLEPYVPSLHRNPAKDRYTVGLLLHSARDSSTRRFVPIARNQAASALGLAKITGAENGLVRFRAPEPGAFDLRNGRLVEADGFRQLPSEPARDARTVMADLATGDDALRLWLSDADTSGGKYRAGFVRGSRQGAILQLAGGGALLVWESKPYRSGTIMVARIDSSGSVAWTVDTGIGTLHQVLPDPQTPALIGERPRVPDKVSEPILVIMDAATGGLTTHSLWLR